MDEVIAWATFAGAWLLVAGPLYQGSVELNELDVDRAGIEGKAIAAQAAQARPSAWWWLLPPVMYLLHRRWYQVLRQAMLAQLTASVSRWPASRARVVHRAAGDPWPRGNSRQIVHASPVAPSGCSGC